MRTHNQKPKKKLQVMVQKKLQKILCIKRQNYDLKYDEAFFFYKNQIGNTCITLLMVIHSKRKIKLLLVFLTDAIFGTAHF